MPQRLINVAMTCRLISPSPPTADSDGREPEIDLRDRAEPNAVIGIDEGCRSPRRSRARTDRGEQITSGRKVRPSGLEHTAQPGRNAANRAAPPSSVTRPPPLASSPPPTFRGADSP